jgi:hypothetical protein
VVLARQALVPASAGANGAYEFVSPGFRLDKALDGRPLIASAVAGVSEIRDGSIDVVAALGGAGDVASIKRGHTPAITGELFDPSLADDAKRLFRISRGRAREVANLNEYEMLNNPDGIWNPGDPESNPFNLAHLRRGKTLIADAAGKQHPARR